jgi:hypothetical protein
VLIVDCHNLLGEGVIFDDHTNTVLWTDILGSKFHSLTLNNSNLSQGVQTVYSLKYCECPTQTVVFSGRSDNHVSKVLIRFCNDPAFPGIHSIGVIFIINPIQ